MRKGENFSPAPYRYVSLIIVVYTVIVILILFWASWVFNTVIQGTPHGGLPVILIPTVLIPPIFLGVSVIIWTKFFRQKRHGIPRYRLRLRLIGIFTLVVISAVILSGLFPLFLLNSSVELWLSPERGLPLEAGEHLAEKYQIDALNRLKNLSESDYLHILLDDVNRDAAQVWSDLSDVAPYLDAIQIAGDGPGRMMGKFEFFFPPGDFGKYNREGVLPTREVRNNTVLSWQSFRDNRRVILTSALVENFKVSANRIDTAYNEWQRLSQMRGTIKGLLGGFVLLIVSSLVCIASFAGIALSDKLVDSAASLGEAIRKISAGDFSFRIPDSGESEIGFLTEPFNRMVVGLSENRAKIIHDERLATWQVIAQRLAHELRNPLTPIKLSAQRILRKAKDGVLDIFLVQKASELILREVNNLNELVQDFGDFAGDGSLRHVKLDVEYLITNLFEKFRAMRPEIEWSLVPKEAILPIMADARRIERMIMGLIRNALEANSTKIAAEWEMVYKESSSFVRFAVLDDGDGISPDRRESVFQPYNSTREGSIGLGLAVARRIVYEHHGRIWFESEVNKGTVFHVELPAGKKS